MAPMKQPHSKRNSSNYGEDVVRQANVLASCYLVDRAASLTGLHYCTTSLTGKLLVALLCQTTTANTFQGQSGIPEVPSSGLPSPPSSPPLAAITANNQLALTPKKRSSNGASSNTRSSRRGGAALRIREESESFFCETMEATFLVERNAATHGSGLTGVYNNNNDNGQLMTPPDEYPFPDKAGAMDLLDDEGAGVDITAWLEIWDYAGSASFRGFVAEDVGEKSLFAFFDAGIVGRDLKQGLMALIELTESALACAQLVICISRAISDDEAKGLVKGLQWAGFSPTTLDAWTGGVDVTSKKWFFMGMEV